MKKFFAFAIAAAAMTVACQNLQDVVKTDAPAEETDLVEIKFSTNIATVETKSVTSLTGLTLQVYGLNGTNPGKRAFYDSATAGEESEGVVELTLTDAPHYYNGNNDFYSFYGYYLDDAAMTEGTELSAENYTTTVTIDGTNDILLAEGDDNGTYCGSEARNGNHPHLTFKHALSQLKFAAVNLGSQNITLSSVTVNTDETGNVTVAGATPSATATTSAKDFSLDMTALSLSPLEKAAPEEGDYKPVVNASSEESELIVFPNSAYVLTFVLEQDGETRTLQYTLKETLTAAYSYQLQIKLYSLEKIEITASLVDWVVASIEINTDDATEVEG